MQSLSQISKAQCEAISNKHYNFKMANFLDEVQMEDIRSSHVAIINSLVKWAEEREKFYTESRDKAQDRRLMTAWQDFESKRMATVNLLTYLKEELEKIKNV